MALVFRQHTTVKQDIPQGDNNWQRARHGRTCTSCQLSHLFGGRRGGKLGPHEASRIWTRMAAVWEGRGSCLGPPWEFDVSRRTAYTGRDPASLVCRSADLLTGLTMSNFHAAPAQNWKLWWLGCIRCHGHSQPLVLQTRHAKAASVFARGSSKTGSSIRVALEPLCTSGRIPVEFPPTSSPSPESNRPPRLLEDISVTNPASIYCRAFCLMPPLEQDLGKYAVTVS